MCSHLHVWVLLTCRHLLGTGKDKRASQEEVEVKDVGHLIRSHQRVGSATAASTGHTTWQGEEEEGGKPEPASAPDLGQGPTGALGPQGSAHSHLPCHHHPEEPLGGTYQHGAGKAWTWQGSCS